MSETVPLVVRGQLEPFFETGTEGVVWSVIANGVPGYDGLFSLSDGDELVIYGANGQTAWQGTVDLEYERRFRSYPLNPEHGQQEILGLWVHGLQRDLKPHVWARAFVQRAPAVVRLRPRGFGNDAVLLQALELLEQDAWDAWAFVQREDKALFDRLNQSLDHAWSHTSKQLGWEPEVLNTPAERADVWQLLLAVSHARRALWAPGLDLEQVLAQRWPSRQALGVVEVQHWLKHRLPHDTVFSRGSCGSSTAP